MTKKKYLVIREYHATIDVEVEAGSPEEAYNVASELFDPRQGFSDYDAVTTSVYNEDGSNCDEPLYAVEHP